MTFTGTQSALLEHAAKIIDDMASELEHAHTSGSGYWPTNPDAADRRASSAVADMRDTARLLKDFANIKATCECMVAAKRDKVETAHVIEAMQRNGGHFVRALAVAATFADEPNLERLKRAWPEYWSKYAEMARCA